jgi:hypothetical protein
MGKRDRWEVCGFMTKIAGSAPGCQDFVEEPLLSRGRWAGRRPRRKR